MAGQGEFWFRPKRYGYGAGPANWKGWAAAGLFMALATGITWFGIVEPSQSAHGALSSKSALSFGALIVMTVAFVWLSWRKTDGPWRWRWGRDT